MFEFYMYMLLPEIYFLYFFLGGGGQSGERKCPLTPSPTSMNELLTQIKHNDGRIEIKAETLNKVNNQPVEPSCDVAQCIIMLQVLLLTARRHVTSVTSSMTSVSMSQDVTQTAVSHLMTQRLITRQRS